MPDTFIKLPNPKYPERSSFVATAYFRGSDDSATAPTTVDYRIDDPKTKTNITPWTSVSAAASVSITVKASDNRMISSNNRYELRQLTVSADRGTTTETRDSVTWKVINNRGFDE